MFEVKLNLMKILRFNLKPIYSLVSSKLLLLPHQIDTAYKILKDLNLRGIVADEVGLGKTIEIGIVLKELILRDQIRNALILTPSSLTYQWKKELEEKFGLKFEIFRPYKSISNFIIASIDIAKYYEEYFKKIFWDLVIVDEAHKIKNYESKRYQFVKNLRKKGIILLSATPIQNSVIELLNLLSLILEIDIEKLKKDFIQDKKGLIIKNEGLLRSLINKYIIRHTRRDDVVKEFLVFPKRNVKTIKIDLSNLEKYIYEELEEFVRENGKTNILKYISILKSSSSNILNLKNYILEKEVEELSYLLNDLNKIKETNKLKKLYQIIENSLNICDKIVIFTEYKRSLEYIYNYLYNKYNILKFYGNLSQRKRKEIVDKFKNENYEIFISTDAGAEGLNLQFSRVLINFDLPWNPMKVEQRIGRIHRIGQEKPIYIFNLINKNTLEEYVLDLLYSKINVFERTIGNLDEILGNIEKDIFNLFLESKDSIEFKNKLSNYVENITKYKNLFKKIDEFDVRVFESFNLKGILNLDTKLSKEIKEVSDAIYELFKYYLKENNIEFKEDGCKIIVNNREYCKFYCCDNVINLNLKFFKNFINKNYIFLGNKSVKVFMILGYVDNSIKLIDFVGYYNGKFMNYESLIEFLKDIKIKKLIRIEDSKYLEIYEIKEKYKKFLEENYGTKKYLKIIEDNYKLQRELLKSKIEDIKKEIISLKDKIGLINLNDLYEEYKKLESLKNNYEKKIKELDEKFNLYKQYLLSKSNVKVLIKKYMEIIE